MLFAPPKVLEDRRDVEAVRQLLVEPAKRQQERRR